MTQLNQTQVQFVSVAELARSLDLQPSMLHYFLKRLKVRTQAISTHANSPRFVRNDQVVDIVAAINGYRVRRPVPGLSAAEAAIALELAPSTVRVLVSQGKLKARHVGQRLSFTREEIERYRKGRRQSA